MFGEIRRNPISGTSIIVAPDRAKPIEQLKRKDPRNWGKNHDVIVSGKECPFCPEREGQTPPEVRAYRQEGTKENEPGWWVRVVPNLLGVVDHRIPSISIQEAEKGPFLTTPAFGYHYVIIETPNHDESFAMMDKDHIREVLSMWRELIYKGGSNRNIKYCFLFKNYGPLAGASQLHSHSQMIALPIIPTQVANEIFGGLRYWEANKQCPYCVEIEWELRMKERVIAETENFLSWSPYTAATPYQIAIAPKFHQSFFGNIATDPDHLSELAGLFKLVLSHLSKVLDDPDYSFYLHAAPSSEPEMPYYHWHFQIEPITEAKLAGFEKGSGVYINPRAPEAVAQDLINHHNH